MTQATASSTATPTMQMSPKRAQQVVKMAQGIRHHFPEFTTISDAQLIYATWRSFNQIDQTNDSDYQTMAKVFFHEFDQHLLHYQFSKAGQETAIRQRFFALLTNLL